MAVLMAVAGMCHGALAQCDTGQPCEIIPDEFVVVLQPGEAIQDVLDQFGFQLIASYAPWNTYLVRGQEAVPDDFEEYELGCVPTVMWVESNQRSTVYGGDTRSFFVRTVRESYTDQPIIPQLHLDETHGISTGAGVSIALLDTGLTLHPDITCTTVEGFNALDGSNVTSDDATGIDSNGNGTPDELAGHGTFIAGLISLAAPGATIMPVKVLDSDGQGSTFTVVAGLHYAATHGAGVINLSLSSVGDSPLVRDAVRFAIDSGAVVVASAGNDNSSDAHYPAAVEGVLGVAGTDPLDGKADFSDFGEYVALGAPAIDVVSTMPDGGYALASGTSFSAALVSGTAVLVRSHNPDYSVADVRSAIVGSSDAYTALDPAYYGLLGQGRLNPLASLLEELGDVWPH